MNAVLKTNGIYILVEEAVHSAREKSAEDQDLLGKSLEEGELRQLLLRILIRVEALEKG
jgi:hypothetical protein